MDLTWTLWLVALSALVFGQKNKQPEQAPGCECDCVYREKLDKSFFACMNIFSQKTQGYLTADEHYVFEPNGKRYVFATNKKKKWGTASWFVYYKDSFNQSYALRNMYLNEWFYAGGDSFARDAFRRYPFTWIKEKEIVPTEGYWQFIPDQTKKNEGYRIRNAWSGEYLYVDDEQHYQRYDYNRVYLYRHVEHMQKVKDNRYWFKLFKC